MQKALIGILGILVLFLAASDVRLSRRVRVLEDQLAAGRRALPGTTDPAASSAPVAKVPEPMPAAPPSSPPWSLRDSARAHAEVPKASQEPAPAKNVPPGGTRIVDGFGGKSPVTAVPQVPAPEPESAAGPRPGFLGIQGEDVPGGGVKINSVVPYSVAGASGLQPEDVIVEVNGERVDSLASLTTRIRGAGEGAPASLRIRRNGVEFYQGVQLGANAPR